MKKTLVLAAVLLGFALPASASTFDFSFSGTGGSSGSITGVLTTGALDAANSQYSTPGYDITAITGTANGAAIAGLAGADTCCSLPYNDNILYTAGSSSLDTAGLAFIAGGVTQAIYFAPGNSFVPDSYVSASGPGTFTITPTAVSEPASLLLLGTGLIGLAFMRRRQ